MIFRCLLAAIAVWSPGTTSAAIAAAANEGEHEPIERIVSLAPHLTELAFAAGAGERILGTVEYSDYPAAARRIPRIGDAFRVDLERLVAIAPDAVLAWDSGTPVQTIERIDALGMRVELFSTQRLQDIAVALRRLGRLAGTSETAESAARQFEQEIRVLRRQYRGRAPVSVFFQINDRPLYTVNANHILSEIVALCGARNVFANLNDLAPAIGIEAVIAADPQVILALDESTRNAAEQWRKWRHIDAVRSGNVFTLSADELARPSTRLSEGAAAVCRALDTARKNLKEEDRG